MTQAPALDRKRVRHGEGPRARSHEPTVSERLTLARDSMVIARFAARSGASLILARRELTRARTELAAVIKVLERARNRSKRAEGRPQPEIVGMLEMSRQLGRELKTLASRIARMN